MNSEDVLKRIKSHYNVSNSDIAKEIHVSRQCISQVDIGKRNMSKKLYMMLSDAYPEIFLNNDKKGNNNVYKIPYCPKICIPASNDLYSNIQETILVDKKLVLYNINQTQCRVVTLSDDSLSPVYNKGDKVIVDTSVKRLLDGHSHLILIGNNYYIRKIKLLPEKVRCISTNNDEDTFTALNKEIKCIGLIVPNLRF